MLPRVALLLLVVTGLGGCRGGPILVDPRRDDRPIECPPDLPPVGRAGEVVIETVPLRWQTREGLSFVDDWIYLGIPDDLASLTVAVDHGVRTTGFFSAVHEGRVLFDLHDDPDLYGIIPPFFHLPVRAGAVTFPVDEDSALPPGCLALDPIAFGRAEGEVGTLHVVSRRLPGNPTGRIDFDVVVVAEATVAEADLQTAFARVDALYSLAGAPGVGVVEIHHLPWDRRIFDPDGARLARVLAAHESADARRSSVFVVQDFTESDTLGFAAGIPGPNGVQGTAGSGLTVSVDAHLDGSGTALDLDLLAETIAHEAGHQLGLFHTSECDGTLHDALEDTPECLPPADTDRDGEVSAEECERAGGRNLMFWGAAEEFRQTELSAAQVRLLSLSPVVR